jgi:hypothetical protein
MVSFNPRRGNSLFGLEKPPTRRQAGIYPNFLPTPAVVLSPFNYIFCPPDDGEPEGTLCREPPPLNQMCDAIRSAFKNANIAAGKNEFQAGPRSVQLVPGRPVQFVSLRNLAIEMERLRP